MARQKLTTARMDALVSRIPDCSIMRDCIIKQRAFIRELQERIRRHDDDIDAAERGQRSLARENAKLKARIAELESSSKT